MLFIALFVVVAFAQPTVPPPLPTYCNATSPMSNARAVSLIGAGNLGPTFISSSPAFGVYTVVCNPVTGCGSWGTAGSSPYLWAGTSAYYAGCSYAPRPFLVVRNGAIAAGFANAQNAICTNPTYVNNFGFSYQTVIPSTANPSSCASCAGITIGATAATSQSLSVSGIIGDSCYQFTSPTYAFPLNDGTGRTAYVVVTLGGQVGNNKFSEVVPLKLRPKKATH